jgi:mannosyltransferase
MVGLYTLTTLRSHKKPLYISLASFLLLVLFWSPQIRPSTRWLKSALHANGADGAVPPPYTAAIIYLAGISRVAEILESLASVNKNLTSHPWPVVLFHAGDFDHDSIRLDFVGRLHDYIGADNGSDAFVKRVEFVKLDWQLPKGISADKEVVNPLDSFRWPGELAITLSPPQLQAADSFKDYHHAFSFFATEIFSHPRLRNVTYFMRLDSSSQFTQPLCYDPFEVMHVQRHSYGYLSIGSDAQEYTQGMWPFVHNYTQTHTAVDRQLRANKWEWPHRDENGDESVRFKGYETSFEIVELAAFRRRDVVEWLNALKSYPEGIFKWRWGKSLCPNSIFRLASFAQRNF